jgi:tetratricopeptide (TPR) repeat protein
MNYERVKNLEQWILEDPTEPFNKYALAMELNGKDPQRVGLLFQELLTQHADYLPTYYIAASFFLDQGDQPKAIQALETGILIAKKQNNLKTEKELASFLDEILFE